MKKKPKAYAVDPVTGYKRIVYDQASKNRFRWDANVPCGIPVPEYWFVYGTPRPDPRRDMDSDN